MSTALSDKAKGKQRATDPGQPSELETSPSKDLTIRFTEGIPDLTVQVVQKDTVKDVKANIRTARPELKDRRLRLIHQGHLLADGAQLYARIASPMWQQRRRNAGATPSGVGGTDDGDDEAIRAAEENAQGTTWLHCSVGPQLKEGEEEEGRIQTAQLKPLRGFDRLAAAGFSERDIANIRLQFHAHSAGDYLDQEFEDQEDFDEHARVLEEQWIDSLDGPNSDLSNSQTAVSSLHNGILFGFFFPLLPLFFFRGHKPAVFWDDGSEHDVMEEPLFSRKMQMGIVVGFLLNVLFGLWTYLLSSS
ncbi:hypothetical protein DICSQDRAFT_55569 [Dichomitus squalens LYAD-421 SS1]|uniref:uncharacterized protein n=1 Tax=Dichomitus squalens (strain LYAD-421) TaxID=732165 RepID=UPI00044123A4|nr:uncharacterized protein DICSQDRAFT_55569 [Dichomitus squalens LYAD-421 SS1]EJF63268.1 hypothetical protein DICSQDRAFT_55569 [Dichomitus squalens LYAD-421 SS1]